MEKNNSSDTILNVDAIKITYLEKILEEKERTIANQVIAIQSLTQQVDLLKHMIPLFSVPTPHEDTLHDHSGTDEHRKPICQHPVQTDKKNNTIPKTSVAQALHNAETLRVCNSIINLNDDSSQDQNPSNTPKWPTYFAHQMSHQRSVHRNSQNYTTRDNNNKRSTKSLLVGTLQHSGECSLRASQKAFEPPLVHKSKVNSYHATNFEVNTSDLELSSHLAQFAPNVKVEKLNARRPDDYASFKISLPSDESQALMDSKIWPYGVVLNHFFPSKKLIGFKD
ncbi:unnamed protein product [Psylliodes chrysocephalus]|uniref:Uncharacterized protein n=1 Tax=Psylliodes chrysocephalus TaxID=3402493 RepID=A0A9P0CHE2_9CUCU|nr:unnamed protein product [Psylliodes chrysocephala]